MILVRKLAVSAIFKQVAAKVCVVRLWPLCILWTVIFIIYIYVDGMSDVWVSLNVNVSHIDAKQPFNKHKYRTQTHIRNICASIRCSGFLWNLRFRFMISHRLGNIDNQVVNSKNEIAKHCQNVDSETTVFVFASAIEFRIFSSTIIPLIKRMTIYINLIIFFVNG